ncbi:MAG: hypothetical protein ABSA92_11705 [Candidatus Bathyarchaeia archaeon]|jgi:hypothetical protein
MNLERKPRSLQWYGGILSYAAAASMLKDFQTEKGENQIRKYGK